MRPGRDDGLGYPRDGLTARTWQDVAGAGINFATLPGEEFDAPGYFPGAGVILALRRGDGGSTADWPEVVTGKELPSVDFTEVRVQRY